MFDKVGCRPRARPARHTSPILGGVDVGDQRRACSRQAATELSTRTNFSGTLDLHRAVLGVCRQQDLLQSRPSVSSGPPSNEPRALPRVGGSRPGRWLQAGGPPRPWAFIAYAYVYRRTAQTLSPRGLSSRREQTRPVPCTRFLLVAAYGATTVHLRRLLQEGCHVCRLG
jgi:hypothetical protein